ncbi:bifunctional DNA-formamidopyrimidine glycosylase/DNA-(apurinic or apyrimidinic site) lyase [Desulfovibrio sp.]|uniref:bifunctional DNA-formamidopyrimidine glycosylase/DNA-(apurinic or apyrimidinic site) lyase n=1 Tax=Desulfovibrio sp. TaxID=885 RepID=UPI0025BBC4EE|nr:bifunctional DNA-formamidopyrimidine glycosylase/DNA-(apurinic or apyrimidinic site) lyase [Desulfovibrio sp.]
MPELPEVETVARTLRPHVQGRVIADAQVLRATSQHPLSLPLQDLRGCRIVDVTRRGKLLLLLLDAAEAEKACVRGMKDLRLAVHLRMTGRLMTYAAATTPGTHTRCILDLKALPAAGAGGQVVAEHGPAGAADLSVSEACSPSGERRLFFDDVRAFGTMLAGTPDMFARWPFWRELGPEPLDIAEAAFAGSIAAKKSAIKAVLLDQKVLAGVGNIYADESLFAAGIDPRRKASELTRLQANRLLQCLRDVLLLSISQCGSSIRDYRDADGNVGAFQNTFAVYGRGGQKCKTCGGLLEKAKVAGRSTVFCPQCQH